MTRVTAPVGLIRINPFGAKVPVTSFSTTREAGAAEDGLRACTCEPKTKQQTCALKKGAPRHRRFIGNLLTQNKPIHNLKLPRRA